jgi:hypothetical protein
LNGQRTHIIPEVGSGYPWDYVAKEPTSRIAVHHGSHPTKSEVSFGRVALLRQVLDIWPRPEIDRDKS